MMKHIKRIAALLLAAAMTFAAVGCAGKNEPQPEKQKTALSVAGIAGPTGIGLAGLMANDHRSDDIDYTFTVATSPDEVVGKFTSGEVQIASVPTNLAAKLYKKLNGDVQMLAINTAGVLYILENGDTVHTMADLRGRTILSTGEGANPEYVLRYLLRQNGLDPDRDVTLEFVAENSELITKLATGAVSVAMVPEPAVTTVLGKNADLRVALNMDDEWNAVCPDSGMLMGCVIAKKSFIAQNKAAVDAFLKEYAASVEMAESDPDTVAALCEEHGITASAAVAKAAIPRCNLVCITGGEMKDRIAGYYHILYEADPTAVGGGVPADDFYYEG